MSSIGDLISNSRKSKQLTQDELAEMAKVNLRTIQRIENSENIPRGNTLKMICNALDLTIPNSELEVEEKRKSSKGEIVFHYFFLFIINLALTSTIGFMTLDSEANLNTRIAGLLLSFFIPMFILYKTKKMAKVERLVKYGSGFLLYMISSIIIVGFPHAFVTGLLVCLTICLLTLYYGDSLIE